MKTKYPKECPVFEILRRAEAPPPVGACVVSVGTAGERNQFIVAMYPDDININATWWYCASDVRPLTPTAREMLAIAEGGTDV